MFVAIPSRERPRPRWATPLLFAALWLCFIAMELLPETEQRRLALDWGALSGGLTEPHDWLRQLRDGSMLRLFSALFLHADWAHLLGNLVFLLIFGLPAERAMGPWRLLGLFLLGGAVANLAAAIAIGTPDRLIIGASGAVSALIGAYLALFPGAKLGVVVPLGLFLQFVKVPAPLLIGVWALLQLVFTFIGPAFGAVAWSAHLAGFAFGGAFALIARAGIARRLRRRRGY
ncbi:membrane associated rhomboid family serine protease [Vulcaniibacterium tengchongense]|uniref:Membrane associated rhomboid family serine protease n=1 Tax=Vulcaniibacterium tengchongense TaxID=1273429 RepID=A0A3N4V3W8_9GAMM|nr:rhomboid family intramembrane serine protease [Vulcaniibacterium tengchongense]RPE75965.1 membrane associated rhomboid family serine protease [Vulcaniibacterium tengchongense]